MSTVLNKKNSIVPHLFGEQKYFLNRADGSPVSAIRFET
jgi:hypothetical protein